MKFYTRIIKQRCLELVQEKKNSECFFTEAHEDKQKKLKDKDLFIDLKLGSHKAIHNLFDSFQQTALVFDDHKHNPLNPDSNKTDAGKANVLKDVSTNAISKFGDNVDREIDADQFSFPPNLKNKAEFYENVPMFLSDTYKKIYLESKKGLEGSSVVIPASGEKESQKKGSTKLYRSKWVQDKMA